MNVKITMMGPDGKLDSFVLNHIDIDSETDDRLSEAVAVFAASVTWAVGDTLTITELED